MLRSGLGISAVSTALLIAIVGSGLSASPAVGLEKAGFVQPGNISQARPNRAGSKSNSRKSHPRGMTIVGFALPMAVWFARLGLSAWAQN